MSRIDLRTGRSVTFGLAVVPGGGAGGGGRPGASPSPAPLRSHAADTQMPAQFAAQQGFGGANLQSNVVPVPSPGEQFRFYWNTPMVLSPHNPRIVYAGGDRFFRSLDRGDTWTASADLTKRINRNNLSIMGVKGSEPMASKNDGYQSYGYVVTIAESPAMPGIIWVGTDDGTVQLSRDSGATWTNVSKKVPVLAEKQASCIT